ncbi:signal peptide protein [Rhodopirellula sp. SWK7]|nr:signal peptide protein [Rhodopirellula sp. SWK7]
MLIPILFALGTAIFWGCYGPTIGNAQSPRVDGVPLWSPFKPYVFIGIAYLVIAIIGGLVMMGVKGDSFSYTGEYFPTAKWGFLAGTLGAFGAVCLTTAMMTSRGNALLVMPIVFGGAVSVSAVVSVIRLHAGTTVSPLLWVGMALTVLGVILVAMNTPHGHAPAKPTPDATVSHNDDAGPLASDVNAAEEPVT